MKHKYHIGDKILIRIAEGECEVFPTVNNTTWYNGTVGVTSETDEIQMFTTDFGIPNKVSHCLPKGCAYLMGGRYEIKPLHDVKESEHWELPK